MVSIARAAWIDAAGIRYWLGLLPVVIGLCACAPAAPKSQQTASAPQNLVWPRPPDQPRFEFETLLQSLADITVENNSTEARWQRAIRGQPEISKASDATVIHKPSAIVSRSGRVYVAEPATKAITVFDAARKKLFRFGLRVPNALQRPQALALDDEGKVYVLDPLLKKVMIFDAMGLFVYSIDLSNGFTNPVGLAVQGNGETIYVVDRGNVEEDDHKVVALNPEGEVRFILGPRGRGAGQFNILLAAAVATDGTLYVVDSGNFRIQAFDSKGAFKFQFGGPGAELGRFSRPRAIALDSDGNVYVSDSGFNNVQIFTPDGKLLMPLGRLSREPGPGNYALIAGIAVDETRRLYVMDHYFKKIDVFRWLGNNESRRLPATEQKIPD